MDVFGPVDVFGRLEDYKIRFISLPGGNISNKQGVTIHTEAAETAAEGDILMVPGGFGSRTIINDENFIKMLKKLAELSSHVLCVCTGSALLAKTGLLDGKTATSNKSSFDWVKGFGNNVDWKRQARWTSDGKYYTSAGVSAGIDMALGFVEDRYGKERAEKIAKAMEYHWNTDKDHDIF